MPELKEFVALLQSWLVVALASGLIAAVLWLAVPAARRPLPRQRLRWAPWDGRRVVIAFLAFFFVPPILLAALDAPAIARWFYGVDVDAQLALRVTGGAAHLLALPVQVAAWCLLAAPVTSSGRRIATDFVTGYRVWLVLTPLVYAVSAVVLVIYGLVVGKQPEGHPILQMFRDGSVPARVVVLLVVEAVLAAPVREELFFRGVLQPWLARRPWGGDAALAVAAVAGLVLRPGLDLETRDLMAWLSFAAPFLLVLLLLPLYRALDRWERLARWIPLIDPETRRQAARAIFGVAVAFANFHASVWPTPIPLFVLALGLGWLAFRTQGVFAPIVLHMLFNAVALVGMLLIG